MTGKISKSPTTISDAKYALVFALIAAAITLEPSVAYAAKDFASYSDGWGENMKAAVNVIAWICTLAGVAFLAAFAFSVKKFSQTIGQQMQGPSVPAVLGSLLAGALLIGIPVLAGVGPATLWGDDAKTVQIGDTNFATSIGK